VYAGANQVVAGLAINLVALGLTGVLYHAGAERAGGASLAPPVTAVGAAPVLHDIALPGLAAVPILGPALFQCNARVYLAYGIAPGLAYFLYRTRAGLRLRATGEHPLAAEAAGARVEGIRMAATVSGGGLAAAGGVYLSVGQLDRFAESMAAGRGFMALAIVI